MPKFMRIPHGNDTLSIHLLNALSELLLLYRRRTLERCSLGFLEPYAKPEP
jgi:hypothetical protein